MDLSNIDDVAFAMAFQANTWYFYDELSRVYKVEDENADPYFYESHFGTIGSMSYDSTNYFSDSDVLPMCFGEFVTISRRIL